MAQRLYFSNLKPYIENTYGQIIDQKGESILTVPFLQRTFEKGHSNCTLTSILTICKYFNKQINNKECYSFINTIAKKYFYKENIGTIPIFINKILKQVFAKYDINIKFKGKYLKTLCWNFTNIKNSINNNMPVILSLQNDGRNYYKNHTVVCKGYITFITEDNKYHHMLEVLDNWNFTSSYIDYDKISIISSINLFSN